MGNHGKRNQNFLRVETLEVARGLKNSGVTMKEEDKYAWDRCFPVLVYSGCLRPSKVYDGKNMKAGHMEVNDCLLHYLIVYILVPQMHNKAQPSDEDMKLIYAFKDHMKLNWAEIVLNHMIRRFSDPSGALPYHVLVFKIIENVGIDLTNEFKLCLQERTDKLDIITLNKMKIVRVNGIWKWHDDMLGAEPQDEDEPVAGEGDQGSSSASVPAYMDDLMNRMQGMLDAHHGLFRGYLDDQTQRLDRMEQHFEQRFLDQGQRLDRFEQGMNQSFLDQGQRMDRFETSLNQGFADLRNHFGWAETSQDQHPPPES